MEINEYKDFADKCFRDTPPPCASVCPLSCDVREFIKQMQRGSYRNAYRVYKNKVIFPTIVSRLCPGKCVSACVRERNAGDKGVDLRALEQLCVDRMAGKKTDRFAVPKKTKQVAVIGGGMSGLACAYRMASYGYAVSVYEKTGLLGGTAGEQLGAEWCDAEIRREFAAVDCSVFSDNQVLELGEIQADAYYIATGADGWDFPGEQNNIFRGGALVGADKIDAIAQGIAAASAIEVFFSTGEREVIPLSFSESPDERYYRLNYDFIVKEDPSGKGAPEALRCMRCNCSACYDICPLMEKEKRFPWKMCTEIPVTLKPFMTNRSGVRMIMGCTDCKRCRDVCPEHIDMGKCLGDARVDFYETGAMSPAFHDFWLQDMEFSQSEEAYLLWKPDKEKKSDVLFFPGCQLGASLPDYVEKA